MALSLTADHLIQQLEDARTQTRQLLERIDRNQEIYPTWTIKHVLAHLTGWDEACIATLEAFLNGTEPGTPAAKGMGFYNDQSVETRQELSFEQIWRECEYTRRQLQAVIARIPDARLTEQIMMPWGVHATALDLLGIFIHHEAEHAAEIAQIITQTDADRARAASGGKASET